MRNDGRDNLLGALLIAGQFVIPEVRKWRWNMNATHLHHIIVRENEFGSLKEGKLRMVEFERQIKNRTQDEHQ